MGERVDHIDVIEIDQGIIEAIGPEFEGSARVTIIEGDALTHPVAHPVNRGRWDCAWHDIWVDESTNPNLQTFHAELIQRFMPAVAGPQGAWKLPRFIKRLTPKGLILR